MNHTAEVLRVLKEHDFPLDKILFSSNEVCFYNKDTKQVSDAAETTKHISRHKMALLYTGSDSLMKDFRARVRKADRTILYIVDNSPYFFPAIRPQNVLDLVKVVFIKK